MVSRLLELVELRITGVLQFGQTVQSDDHVQPIPSSEALEHCRNALSPFEELFLSFPHAGIRIDVHVEVNVTCLFPSDLEHVGRLSNPQTLPSRQDARRDNHHRQASTTYLRPPRSRHVPHPMLPMQRVAGSMVPQLSCVPLDALNGYANTSQRTLVLQIEACAPGKIDVGVHPAMV